MHTAGYIWDTVLRQMRREARGLDEELLKRLCNEEYAKLASMTSWEMLRTKFDLSLVSGGVNFPSNILGIEAVKWADGDTNEYIDIVGYRESDVEKHQSNYRWHFFDYITNRDGVDANWTESVANGATTLTYAAGAPVADYADWVGEYLKIGTDPFVYEITDVAEASNGTDYVFTFSPTYRGSAIDNADIQVRPVGSKKFRLIDRGEDEVVNRTLTVHGWKMPDGLYDEHDVILTDPECLWLMTIIRMLEVVGRRERVADTYRARLNGRAGRPEEGALHKAINANPSFAASPVVRDRNNNPFRFGTGDMYSTRKTRADGWFAIPWRD